MSCKIIFRVGLCAFLLTIFSCSTSETAISETAISETATSKPVPQATITETAQPVSKELVSDNNSPDVLISLGDEKLTVQQLEWLQPNANEQQIAGITKWWLENELLYAEAKKRGIANKPKAKFVAELTKKKIISQQLAANVYESVEISDQNVLDYYEKNKQLDPSLTQPGFLGFSHIRTRTAEEAQAAIERIK